MPASFFLATISIGTEAVMDSPSEQYNNYSSTVSRLLLEVETATTDGAALSLAQAFGTLAVHLGATKEKGRFVFTVGNGGSSAIASHFANDLSRMGTRALALCDATALTAAANDFGVESMFATVLEGLATKDDVLISISSSGQSKNIRSVQSKARALGMYAVSLTGFLPDNPVRRAADLSFYVPSSEYLVVESVHFALAHFLSNSCVPRTPTPSME
jgi:D-sedoheptulose 7-phosphate isomerase